MDRIKFSDPKGIINSFEIPWDWMEQGTCGPILNDLESKAERGINTAKLSRTRAGEVPAATLPIDKRLTQKEFWPLLQLLKLEKINVYYFEKYLNTFVTREFYPIKANPSYWSIPEDNNTDNIVYDKFDVEFTGYGDVN